MTAEVDHKANIRLWVDALRSGKYSQGRGSLHYEDSYCCLGVLCDVSGLGYWGDYSENIKAYITDSGYHTGVPPNEVFDWIGIATDRLPMVSYPSITDETIRVTLMDLNDVLEVPFTEIADLIEEELL